MPPTTPPNPTPLTLPFHIGIKLDPGETVRRVIYRHPFDLLPTLAVSISLELISLALGYIAGNQPEVVPFNSTVTAALIGITTLLAALFLIIGYYVYRHNVLIFTTVHLVYVEQVGLFGRRVSQLNFRNVEDVTGTKAGLFKTIFNYGDVTVQSAGEVMKFVFHNAPNPTGIADDALMEHERCMHAPAHNPETKITTPTP